MSASNSRLTSLTFSRSDFERSPRRIRSKMANCSSLKPSSAVRCCSSIQVLNQIHELGEGLLDGDAVLLAVVVGDDLLVLLVVVHPHRVAGEHLGQLLLDDLADVLQRRRLALHLLGELVAQLLQVDLAQVDRQPSAWSSPAASARMASLTMRCSSLSRSVTSAVSRRSCSFL